MEDSEKSTHAILSSLLTSFFLPTSDVIISYSASLSSSFFHYLLLLALFIYLPARVCS